MRGADRDGRPARRARGPGRAGWLALSVLAFAGAAGGHSLIGGYEQPAFVGMLVAGIAFETAWRRRRGTNALTARARDRD